MAEKIEVVIKHEATKSPEKTRQQSYQKQYNTLSKDYDTAVSKGATKVVSGSETAVIALKKEIEELLKIAEPTHKQMSLLRKKINEFAEINEKLGKAIDPISTKLQETLEKETKLTKQRAEAVKKQAEAQELLAKKSSGELGLKNSVIEKRIAEKGLVYTSGRQKDKNVSASKFMEMGESGNFSKLSDPSGAKELYEALLKAQKDALEQVKTSKEEISNIDSSLEGLQAQTVTVNAGEEIILNARGVKFENEKEVAAHQVAKTSPDKQPTEVGKSIQPLGESQEKKGGLGKVVKQLTLYNFVLKSVKKAINDAVQTVKELDKSLTEQAMVTGKSREETYALIGSYQKLATECGATTKEIASVATEYMKQGKTIQDSLTLTEAAVKAAKVARVSVGDSVNYLTTALNGFQLQADDAMKVSDKFAAVAAASATDYDELAIALSKVASQANLAGMSIDYTTALLTKGLETTREAPETMGTALKTIIARMRELSDYGETLDDGMDINNVEKQLGYVGIALRDQQGELRSTEDVLDELGKKWDGLNKNQQAAIAKALAGTRQQSRLIAMMEDYERVTELQEISARSAGATTAQAEVYLEGMEASINKISVAWEKVVMTFTDSELIIGFLNIIGKGLDFVGDFIGTTEGMVVALVLVGNAIVNIIGARSKEYNLQKKQYELQKLMAKKEAEDLRAEAKEKFIKDPKKHLSEKQAEKFDKDMAEPNKEVANAEAELKKNSEAVLKQQKILTEAKRKLEEEQTNFEEANETYLKEKAILDEIAQYEQKQVNEEALLEQKLLDEDIIHQQALAHEKERHEIAMVNKKLEAEEITKEEADAQKKKIQDKYGKRADKLEKTKDKKTEEINNKKQQKTNEINTKNEEKTLEIKTKLTKAQEKLTKAEDEYNKEKNTQSDLLKKEKKSQDALNVARDKQNTVLNKYFEGSKENLAITQALADSQEHLNIVSSTFQIIMSGVSVVTGIVNAVKSIGTILSAISTAMNKKESASEREKARAKLQATAAQWGLNGAMYACPIVWIIALVIALIAALALLVVGIVALVKAFIENNDESAKAAKNIKELSAEIYECDKKARDLRNALDVFDELDEKVLKTKEDMAAMNEQMDKLAESMSTEAIDEKEKNQDDTDKMLRGLGVAEGQSAKDYYDSLGTDKMKREFAESVADGYDQIADKKRNEQIKTLKGISTSSQRSLLESDAAVADAVYAINNNSLYESIDALETKVGLDEEERKSLESLTQSVLENMEAWDAWQLAQNPGKIQEMTEALSNINLGDTEKLAADVLQNDDESLKDRLTAYRQISEELAHDKELLEAFQLAFKEWEFWDKMDETAMNTLDALGLTADEINDVYSSYKKLNDLGIEINKEEYHDRLEAMWTELDDDLSNFEETLRGTFGDIVKDNEEAWNELVSSIGDTIATSVLDMGQKMEKFGNTINGFYEKASNWGSMSETEKMEFISDNASLFQENGGQELLAAFESGDYKSIETALAKQMKDDTEEQLTDIRRTLAVEMARTGEDRNEAYIKALQDYEAYLMDGNDLYKASLELRLEQEQKELDQYKALLEERQKAEEEALEKRKKAYEDYFNVLDQEEEDAEYDEEADLLTANLSKLASSDSAAAKQQTKELEQQLKDLESERLKELRERAQEAVLEDMDDQLEEINEKFSKLLENNQAMLAAMRGELDNPLEMLTEMIGDKAFKGATANELEEFLGTLQGTYGTALGGADLENIDVREENNQLILNVNGHDIVLDSQSEENLYAAIMKALTEIGVR